MVGDLTHEVLRLKLRLGVAEQEIKSLRESRHDHANKISAVLVTIEIIRKRLDDLQGVPGEIQSIRERVGELESEVRGVREEVSALRTEVGGIRGALAALQQQFLSHAAAIEGQLAAVLAADESQSKEIGALNRRLAVKDLALIVVVQIASAILQKIMH